MFFHQRFIPGLSIASYLVGDEQTGEAIVIDPTRDVQPLIDMARENELHIRHIVETHVHADFISGSCELKARLNGQPSIYCSGYGGDDWTQEYADVHVKEGDEIKIGQLRLGFLHTPGHTPEHITITLTDTSRSSEVPWLIFTGDFLFVGDVGRPDLLGEKARQVQAHQLYHSAFEKISDLADFTEIFPAHGAGSLCGKAIGSRRSSTLGFERRFNASLQRKPEDQWVRQLMKDMPLAPSYFRRMKQINKDWPEVLGPQLPGQHRLSVEEVNHWFQKDCLILDTRSKEAFAASHIPHSINIPLGPNMATWSGWVLPYDTPLLIVSDDPAEMEEITTHLIRIGLDDVKGFLEGGISAWQIAGQPLDTLNTFSVHNLQKQLRDVKKGKLTVLDVRTEQEWNDGHIEGAMHIHGGTLQERFEDIPRDKPVAVVCGSGYRASIASSFLKRVGFDDVTNVMGGMSAWMQADLPVAKPKGR